MSRPIALLFLGLVIGVSGTLILRPGPGEESAPAAAPEPVRSVPSTQVRCPVPPSFAQDPRLSALSKANQSLDSLATELARQVDDLERALLREDSRYLPDRHLAQREAEDDPSTGGGVPASWPEDLPEDFTAAAMRARLQRAAQECDLPGDLISIDCDEPPCMAAFRMRGEGLRSSLLACPAWSEVSDGATTQRGDSIPCGDGTKESLLMIGTSMSDLVVDPAPDDKWNSIRRLRDRANAVADNWSCAD